MNVEPGTPMLMIDSVGYRDDGTPIEYYHAIHRGDRTRFRVELVRSREHRGHGGGYPPDQEAVSTIEILPPPNAA